MLVPVDYIDFYQEYLLYYVKYAIVTPEGMSAEAAVSREGLSLLLHSPCSPTAPSLVRFGVCGSVSQPPICLLSEVSSSLFGAPALLLNTWICVRG